MKKNNIVTPTLPLKIYMLIAFIEGGCVMAIELLGAKMLTPFYGASLYVWTSVFVTTLGGLALGYYLGGWSSKRKEKEFFLFLTIWVGAILIALMPVISIGIMNSTANLGVRLGSLISCCAFMLLPLICMGMVSPMIIELLSKQLNYAGKAAGTVYAVSTIGGIFITILLGFFLIPEFGIKKTTLFFACLLGAIPISYFFFLRKRVLVIISLISLIILSFQVKSIKASSLYEIKYESEGLLGQILVIENPINKNGELKTERKLFVNRVMQSYNLNGSFESFWTYPHRISILSSIKSKGSKALVMGYGGGSIASELINLEFKTTGVELDARIKEVAEKFFFANENKCPIIIDDARHYIQTCKEKYDLIIFDLLRGEVQPSHVLTTEGLSVLKNILNTDGLVIVNFQGEMEGDFGLGARSILKTLKETGYDTQYSIMNDPQSYGIMDILFVASPSKLPDLSKLSEEKINTCCKQYNFGNFNPIKTPFSEKIIDLSDALILTDDKPILEHLNNPTIELWRKNMINNYTKPLMDNGIPLFEIE